MAFCKVNHMNVISHASSVRSIIVIAKHAQLFQLSYGNLSDIRHQVVWNTIWIFSDSSALMSSDRVKVTKKNYIPFRICFLNIREDLLKHGLCPAIRIGTLSLWAFFCNRDNCRISIYSCRRRENNIFNTMFSHYIYESQCSGNIVLIIFPRLCNRFSYCFQPCKMDTGINILFFKNIIQRFSVKNICLVEFY